MIGNHCNFLSVLIFYSSAITYHIISMNLSLIFLVLSAFIGFLLYDMFKKSRQQQELANAHQSSAQKLGASQSRLKPNYQA